MPKTQQLPRTRFTYIARKDFVTKSWRQRQNGPMEASDISEIPRNIGAIREYVAHCHGERNHQGSVHGRFSVLVQAVVRTDKLLPHQPSLESVLLSFFHFPDHILEVPRWPWEAGKLELEQAEADFVFLPLNILLNISMKTMSLAARP